MGRTMGRMHAVGAARPAPNRPRVTIERYIREPLDVLLSGDFIPGSLAPRYRDIALSIADAVAAPMAATRAQRIHGDLHWGNILWAKDGPILVDFDDWVMGPAGQDIWLLARGDSDEARKMRADLLEGTSCFENSIAARSRSASRYAPCASSTCRAGLRGAGTIRRFRPRSRTFATRGTGCRSTRRLSASRSRCSTSVWPDARRRRNTTPLTPPTPSMIRSRLGRRRVVTSTKPTGESTSAAGGMTGSIAAVSTLAFDRHAGAMAT